MALTGTKRIIQDYIEHGGAQMDEEAYQEYRRRMLENWLVRYFDFTYREEFVRCRKCGVLCGNEDDRMMEHMREEYPEMFKA